MRCEAQLAAHVWLTAHRTRSGFRFRSGLHRGDAANASSLIHAEMFNGQRLIETVESIMTYGLGACHGQFEYFIEYF